MGQILLKFDNQLEQSDIIMPLVSSSYDELGDNYEYNQSDIQQTKVYGIKTPLIEINNIIIDFDNIVNFSLKSHSTTPTISLTVIDKYDLISSIDTPGIDNELRVQIIPSYDNAYKKINLTFFIKNIKIINNFISIVGVYKVPSLIHSQFKSFGNINTYKLFENIAIDSKLGFATNTSENDSDNRYIYCDYKSYLDIMDREINYAGNQLEIYDYWIDFWNNINFVNIYERYNSIDSEEDMTIWVSGDNETITEGVVNEPIEVFADINNHPMYNNTELCVEDYYIINNAGLQCDNGTDKVYSIYLDNKQEYLDHLIQDSDVKNDIYIKHEYLGENIGEYNYLLQKKIRESFIQKMNTESIEVVMKYPLLGLMRGDKVNFTWYINDSMIEQKLSTLYQDGIIDDPDTIISYDSDNSEENQNISGGLFTVDKNVSGQYLITSVSIEYSDNKWQYKLRLNRPASHKPKFINNE